MRTYVAARYFVALVMLFYGFAKLAGAQFTVLDSELERPMGEVSGFWLTWYYFGFSGEYRAFVALAEIGGALLLLARRTTLLGALVLLPVLMNVVLVDIFFRIDPGALLVAVVLLGAVLYLLSRHARELKELFWTRQNAVFPARPRGRRARAGKAVLCTVMVGATAGVTWWTANYNNIIPTPLDGAWDVVQRPDGIAAADVPSRIYFERNRAWMAVFRYGERRLETHHFEVDPASRSLSVWRDWFYKGPQLFDGGYELRGDRLHVTGRFAGQARPATLVLQRRRVPRSGRLTSP